jgi:hypothetical protein
VLAAILLLAALGPAQVGAKLPSAKEYELKAAYLFNFTRFTSWPASSFAGDTAPLVIGILGNQNIAAALEQLVKSHVVNGHRVDVRTVPSIQDTDGLHVLFVDVSHDKQLGSDPGGPLSKPGLLTVGESDRFLAAGGTIRLLVEGNRLLFEVNGAAAQGAGLTLSSQLLALAKTVHKAP